LAFEYCLDFGAWDLVLILKGSGGFGDRSGPKAPGANLHPKRSSLFHGGHFLEIGIPDFPGLIICVTHIMPKDRPFSADFTNFCHGSTSTLI
jgi:hypothetical protein